MQVQLEVNFCAGLDQTAGAFREHVTFFADRVLIQEHSLLSHFKRAISAVELTAIARLVCGLDNRCSDVLNNRESFDGYDLDSFDVSIFLQTGIYEDVGPLVG